MTSTDPPIRLLLADDEVDFRDALARAFSRRGFVVTTAEDGARALAVLAEQEFDVAILDVKMPGLDGVEVFHRVVEDWPGLPVILLTGHGTVQQAFQTSRDGVYDYLAKPCEVDRLAAIARRAATDRLSARLDPDGPPPVTAREIRVLVVDDEPDIRRVLTDVLGRRGMQVTAAADGPAALARLAARDLDVVLLDVKLPGMDGLEVLRRIKQLDPTLEVILLTGHPAVDLAVEGMRAGAFDYLTKPQDLQQLTAKVQAAFGRCQDARAEARSRHIAEILDGSAD